MGDAQWDGTNHASKDNLLRVVRNEAESVFELADKHWTGPTRSGHWEVRDIVGHQDGYKYEQGDVDDLPVVFEFDPASLVLTAFGRVSAGTAYGDQNEATRYRQLFFSI